LIDIAEGVCSGAPIVLIEGLGPPPGVSAVSSEVKSILSPSAEIATGYVHSGTPGWCTRKMTSLERAGREHAAVNTTTRGRSLFLVERRVNPSCTNFEKLKAPVYTRAALHIAAASLLLPREHF